MTPPALHTSPAEHAQPSPLPARTVGVLLVHGIGEQPRGDTLLRFGEPIVRWLEAWVRRRRPGETVHAHSERLRRNPFRVLDAVLGDPGSAAEGPSHTILAISSVDVPPREDDSRSRWVLAESWWAPQFRRPGFGALARWLLSTGSWMILSHFGKSARSSRRTRSGARAKVEVGVRLVGLGLAACLAMLVQLAVAGLAVLAVLPIPPLRRMLSSVLLWLTGALGDSFVLLSSPLQRRAAAGQVARDLAWLAERCEQVVVVAHSQGAAIAHAALRSSAPTNLRGFVSVGSGLGKLEELRILEEENPAILRIAQIAIPAFFLVLFSILTGSPWLYRFGRWPAYVAFLYAGVFLLSVAKLSFKGARAYEEKIPRLSLGIDWLDVYASADPVPNGSLASPLHPVAGLRSLAVENRRSPLTDHTTYFDNRDQFVAALVHQLDAWFGTGLFAAAEQHRLEELARLRTGRTRILSLARFVGAAVMVAYVLAHVRDMQDLGKSMLEALAGAPAFDVLGGTLSAAADLIGWLAKLTTRASDDELRSFGVFALGAMIPAGAMVLCFLGTCALWGWRDGQEVRRIFAPGAAPDHWLARAACTWIVILSALAPLIAVALERFGGSLGTSVPPRLAEVTWGIATVAVVAGAGIALANRVKVLEQAAASVRRFARILRALANR